VAVIEFGHSIHDFMIVSGKDVFSNDFVNSHNLSYLGYGVDCRDQHGLHGKVLAFTV